MNNCKIEEIKYGFGEGGLACGPIEPTIVVQIKFNDEGITQYLSNVEICGMPCFYSTREDIFDKLISEDFDDEFTNYLNDSSLSYENIDLTDYEKLYKSLKNIKNQNTIKIIRLLITLTRRDFILADFLSKNIESIDLEKIEIPMSDIELDLARRKEI